MSLPAGTLAGPLLTMATSACALIVVFALELSLFAVVSALDVLAVAGLFAAVPFATLGAACTVMVNCALWPLGSTGMVQETVPFVPDAGVPQFAAGPVSCASDTKRKIGRASC